MESVLEILSYVGWVLLAITILVFIHEMGHFLFAKLFKMRVERFSVGFPPKIFGKTIGETEYVVGATPLGGYVKISGMVDESLDAEQLASEPEPWEFRAKPVWQRMVVIVAGVTFNMLLAVAIFAGLKAAYGEQYIPAENIEQVYVEEGSLFYDLGLRTGDQLVAVNGEPLERYDDLMNLNALLADRMTITVRRGGQTQTLEAPEDLMTQLNRAEGDLGVSFFPTLVGAVVEDSPAQTAGLQSGDRIVALGGEPVQFWEQMTARIQASGGEATTLQWVRPDTLAAGAAPEGAQVVARRGDGVVYEASVTPKQEGDRYLLGVYHATPEMLYAEYGVQQRAYGLGEALVAGVAETWQYSESIVVSFKRVFSGRDSIRENLGGPIAIAKVTKEAADAGAQQFWFIVAMLSITLAIINILPIPALDGGHLMFLIYEGVTRREPSLKVRMVMQQVGMILLLVFMTFLIFNDILRL